MELPSPRIHKMGLIKIAIVLLFIEASFALPLHYNAIDKCWRKNPNWAQDRKKLATCAKGFGARAKGGKLGDIYTVTRDDDNPVNPAPGSLRYAVSRHRPLWITFARDMYITLHMPLFLTSHKTLDGRGANVHIAGMSCLRVWNVTHVIIHGLIIHDCKESTPGNVLISTTKGVEKIYPQDGDAISIQSAKQVWIDHNTLSHCDDGLIDVTLGSNKITISNNWFFNHNEAMLLGNSDEDQADKNMMITVAFNRFGPGLMQRMPRIRKGYAHVANNFYNPWGIYAIGGSSDPTILSEGNVFVGPNDYTKKQVTEHKGCDGSLCVWRSLNDEFLQGAYFEQSGLDKPLPMPMYKLHESFRVLKTRIVPLVTKEAGALTCIPHVQC
ncbi:pectate lyase 1 [Cryptomeria japonica]|uniref:pectate lyase 1 n=1 Tax=Cryptomeria japonica TaxID=3369 RepID=UPI0025AC532B|nr:pectate lyase 1 [Cryptomeria japonica]